MRIKLEAQRREDEELLRRMSEVELAKAKQNVKFKEGLKLVQDNDLAKLKEELGAVEAQSQELLEQMRFNYKAKARQLSLENGTHYELLQLDESIRRN